jgi:DNA mismatch repair protein MutL
MPAPELLAGRIRPLPSAVADAIAAGEVVDRPAAVVKELIENALDAGARRIVVRVEEAGRRLVEVIDDGAGILAQDLALAFRRHATSKIAVLDDLGAIRTLGFRGEALASIAAVSDVEAVSRRADAEVAGRVRLRAGELMEEGAAGGPVGTRVSIRELFYNTPARLRFLKQPATESAVIARLTGELALARPEVAIHLHFDGRSVLASAGDGDRRSVLAAIYGAETAAAMLAVHEPPVSGLISPPALSRATRDHLVILVNGRRVHHRGLSVAVEQAYRGLRDPDRYPIAVLALDLDPHDVDVNVHPTKREVRLRQEGAVFAALQRSCFRALRQSPLYELEALDSSPALRLRETAVASGPQGSPRPPLPASPDASGTQWSASGDDGQAVSAAVGYGRGLPELAYVGQLLDSYLVAQAQDMAVLVDQHAAHERVLFDRILRRMGEGSMGSQPILIGILIDVTPEQLDAFEQHREWLARLGFAAEPFGLRTLRLGSAPLELRPDAAPQVLTRLLHDLEAERSPDLRLRKSAALLACHGAVRFGDRMSPEAAAGLLSELRRTDEPISCPHGRPTALMLPEAQLRRLFKRP